jgi:nitroreductase
MDVYEAMHSRRSVRGFLERPVPTEVLTRVLSTAVRAPSGGNLQPWQVYVLSDGKLDDLRTPIRKRIAAGDSGDHLPVRPYLADLPTVYARRLADMGERRYGAVGLARGDKKAGQGSAPGIGNASGVGYADPKEPRTPIPRAPLRELVTFLVD